MRTKTIRTTKQLIEAGIVKSNAEEIEAVIEKFSVSITPQILKLMDPENNPDFKAIRQQYLPSRHELNIQENELSDPIGDSIHTSVKGVVHRYPDRCLLMPLMSCPTYCRFCFRREKVGERQALSLEELNMAYDYIKSHPEIWEVILSGGDPLILKPKKLAEILSALEAISTVGVIRIHTKVPVVDSKRINTDMLKALKRNKAVYIILHANHPSEFTHEVKEVCGRIVDMGIPMLGQTVLLKGVNDNATTLAELMKTFVSNRIKPYYLHHLDLAKGTSHFRTPIKDGKKIVKSLRGQYSGLCQPTYILDLPGGHGKVPICDNEWAQELPSNNGVERYQIEDYQGNIHIYGID